MSCIEVEFENKKVEDITSLKEHNKRGLSTVPCGTPVGSLNGADVDLLDVIGFDHLSR